MQVVGIFGVICSLVFVGLELRQSTITAKAAAFQELGIATSEFWLRLSENPEMLEIQERLGKPGGMDNLTWVEEAQVVSQVIGNFRVYETVHLQVELGLLDEEYAERLGWGGSYVDDPVTLGAWPSARTFITPHFREYLESRHPELESLSK
jgi:hypothetical protein